MSKKVCIFAVLKIWGELSILKTDLVAQQVEQYTFNVWVLGSSPNGVTKKQWSNSI